MPYSDKYSDLYDPAFPQSGLDLRTELLLGGTWTDISSLFYQRAGTTITRGHPDESSSLQPATAPMQLNNRSGNLSPRNPYGAYFGLLGRNTPLRLSTPAASPYLRLEDNATGYASCPDVAAFTITDTIDVRVDMKLSGYGQMTLVAKWNSATDRSWNLHLNANGTLALEVSDSSGIDHPGTSSTPIPLGRIAVRATFQGDNGAGGRTYTFYTAPTIAGPWTQLGVPVTTTGTLVLQTTTAPITVGYSASYVVTDNHASFAGPTGQFYRFQLYHGIAGTLVADSDFSAQVPGTSTFADGAGNIWTLGGVAEISGRRYRMHGEVPAWPPRWDNTGQDVYVPVEPSGILRRLTQGTPPVQSAMFRAYGTLTGSVVPAAYWPCEDGSNATSIASALPAGSAMQVHGSPSFASSSAFVCSQAIPTLNGSSWTGTVGAASAWSSNTLRFLLAVPSGGDTNNAVIARFYSSGTVSRLDMVYGTGGTLTLTGYGIDGSQVFTSGAVAFNVNGQTLRASMEVKASGSSVAWSMGTLAPGSNVALVAAGTLASASVGAVGTVAVNPGGLLTGTAIGHVSVQAVSTDLFGTLAAALNANLNEAAAVRFGRLCTEQGIPYRIYGFPADSVAMGYQSPGDFVSLLQQCEDADRGLMFEPRQVLGLGYRTRSSMCNQAAVVALDYAQAQLSPPIEPTDDDQYTVNDATVTRSSGSVTGSSARQYLASGSESVASPPSGVGDYGSTYSLNVATDGQASQEAGWIVHVGTVDEPRYPSITVDLSRAATASVSAAAQDADIGDRITVANTPTWLPPDGISQIIRGSVESLNAFELTEQYVCVPESPYRVGIYDDATYGHYDTDGSTLATNINSSATTFQVKTTNAGSPLWTTNAADFPFDIEVSPAGVGGERMTVTNITGSSSPQTFMVTRAVNGVARSWAPGTDIRLFQPAVYSL